MAASDAKREFFGQPAWIWAVAGLVTVAAAIYLYRRNAQRQAGQDTGAAAAAGDGTGGTSGVSSLTGWLLDHQSSPTTTTTTTTTCPPGYKWSAKKHRCYKPKAA